MANTLKFGNGQWATGNGTALAYNDENSNFKPLPFDFTRASSGTVVNQSGLIETVGSGIPRIDFQGNTKGALLLEPSRTNIVTDSELLNTFLTTKSSGAVITDNYGISPNGLQNSSRIQLASSDYCLRGLSLSTNSTSSVYVKGIKGETIQFGVGANVGQGGLFTFNGAWQRIEYTYQNGSGSLLFSNLQGGATATDFEAFGLQVEDDSTYATSYIPTSGSTVTRVADACSNGANEQVINSTEGVLYADISALTVTNSSNVAISVSDNSIANRIFILYSVATNIVKFQSIVGNTTAAFMQSTLTDITVQQKIAFRWNGTTFSVFIDGAFKNSDDRGLSFSSDTLNTLAFNRGSNAENFVGKAKDIRVYNEALTDQELIALTQV